MVQLWVRDALYWYRIEASYQLIRYVPQYICHWFDLPAVSSSNASSQFLSTDSAFYTYIYMTQSGRMTKINTYSQDITSVVRFVHKQNVSIYLSRAPLTTENVYCITTWPTYGIRSIPCRHNGYIYIYIPMSWWRVTILHLNTRTI